MMRAQTISILVLTILYSIAAAPANTKLQTGQTPINDYEGKPYIEEVTVESVLQVLTPGKTNRQYRTNTQTSLQDGTRVEARHFKNQ